MDPYYQWRIAPVGDGHPDHFTISPVADPSIGIVSFTDKRDTRHPYGYPIGHLGSSVKWTIKKVNDSYSE
jgi:hypothetical protein